MSGQVVANGLVVALGDLRYRVVRPWGDIPAGPHGVTDVATLPDGRVIVLLRRDASVTPSAPTVIVLAPDGTRLAAWGEDVQDGHMIQTAPDGRVFVVDRDAHQVLVRDAEGVAVATLGRRHEPDAPFSHPCDVAVASDGSVLVADGYGAARVHRFDAGGMLLQTWGAPGAGAGEFSTPHAVWGLADGRVLVADRENDRVQVFDRDGHFLSAWPDLYRPMDIATLADGSVIVSDQVPRLSRFSPDGRLIGRCRPVLNGAHGLAVGADGSIFCAEINPSRVTRLTPL